MQSPPSPAASSGSLIRGKYRLLRRIGEGAMGVVWAAFNEATSREVAVKLLVRPDPDLRERLLREARACGAVQHRNVVDIYDADETDSGDPFLVMPLLAGETLAALIKRRRRIEPPEAARIARDMARGLAAAHDLGIIHRDLKPSNIFLHMEPGESDYVVKILDFGVSKVLTGSHGFRTATGMLVGSPAYMSPEQVRALPDIDHRIDLWTLGVVLFEMLAGVRPIQGKSHEILMRVVLGEIPPVSHYVRQIDPGLEAVVSHCLQRDRELRPRSAGEVAVALEPFVRPASRQRGSGPDWRGPPPAQAAVAQDRAEPARPSQAEVFTMGGTMFMSPAAAAQARDGDDATTVPRGSRPQIQGLGDFGTVKMSNQVAAAHRAPPQQHQGASPAAPPATAAPGAQAPYPMPPAPFRVAQDAAPPPQGLSHPGPSAWGRPSPSDAAIDFRATQDSMAGQRSVLGIVIAAVAIIAALAIAAGYLALRA